LNALELLQNGKAGVAGRREKGETCWWLQAAEAVPLAYFLELLKKSTTNAAGSKETGIRVVGGCRQLKLFHLRISA
jgi:hypothetical protein